MSMGRRPLLCCALSICALANCALANCALAICALACWSGFSAAAESVSDRLRVITYNVQFLPEPVSDRNERPDPIYRAKRIGNEVRSFDLIALQETFHDTHRMQLLAEIGKASSGKLHSIASPTPEGFLTSGGCLLASRLPLIAHHSTVFASYSRPAEYGLRADGFAAKGVLHARFGRTAAGDSRSIDVFVTHLEARADHLRPRQYAELAEFVQLHSSAARPALVLGDLNTRGSKEFRSDSTSQYSQLMRELAAVRTGRAWVDVWAELHATSLGGTTKQESADVGKRIDYVLLSNPNLPHPQLIPRSAAVRLFQDPKVTALSDHNAVIAELEWR
ncbi:MAG: endonuclease/exonuclease/phosphatase family protein [Bythopirellula sp.]